MNLYTHKVFFPLIITKGKLHRDGVALRFDVINCRAKTFKSPKCVSKNR